MVRRNVSRQRGRNRANNMRAHMRRLQQAVNNQATLTRLPNDPPNVKLNRTFTIVAPVIILSSTTAGESKLTIAPTPYTEHVYTLGKPNANSNTSPVIAFTAQDINMMFLVGIGLAGVTEADTNREVVVNRVAMWGPNPQVASYSIKASWASTLISKTAVDIGSPLSRSKIGFSFPQTYWMDVKIDPWKAIVLFQGQFDGCSSWPGTVGTPLGVIHVTISGRLKNKLA